MWLWPLLTLGVLAGLVWLAVRLTGAGAATPGAARRILDER
ncbi:hypothetical protein ACIA5A_17455 [Micromonospora sp. NPDC051300]